MIKEFILAALIPLSPGYNNVGQSGEVVAVQAATSNATATVSVKAVESLTTYTNVTQEVVTYEPAWRVTVTNFAPSAARFALPDNAFPITAQGVTVSSNDGLTFVDGGTEIYANDATTGNRIANFMGLSPWPFTYSDFDGILFNGIPPDSGESPNLNYIIDPLTYVTNVVGYLNYDDFKWTNGVSTIVGEPVRFDMAITNTVVVQRVPAQTYAKTNTLATVTTSGHFGSTVTNAYIFGGGIVVEGAQDGDKINLLIK